MLQPEAEGVGGGLTLEPSPSLGDGEIPSYRILIAWLRHPASDYRNELHRDVARHHLDPARVARQRVDHPMIINRAIALAVFTVSVSSIGVFGGHNREDSKSKSRDGYDNARLPWLGAAGNDTRFRHSVTSPHPLVKIESMPKSVSMAQ